MRDPQLKKTQIRILTAAESLFANQGYHGTTLRQVTQKAKVNLAAVNYHYGDKESLYVAVIRHRIRPINQARLTLLAEAERAADGKPVPLSRIVEIMARPIFELGGDPASDGQHTVRLLGRILAEPLPFMDEVLAVEFHPAMASFGQAVRRHAPTLTPEDFLWRLSFVVGAMHHTLATMHRMKDLTRGICRNDDHEGALRRFVQFAVPTFTAPVSQT